MQFRQYILRRALYGIMTLFLIANINFLIFQLIPQAIFGINPVYFFIPSTAGGSSTSTGGTNWSPALTKQVETSLGLNQPWDVRYERYIYSMFTGNFGYSFLAGHAPVLQIIAEYAPRTILLLVSSIIASVVIGSLLGAYSASHRGKKSDKSLLGMSFFTFSVPSFWVGLMLLFLLAVEFHVFPLALSTAEVSTTGATYSGFEYITHLLWAMALPWATLTVISFGSYLLIVRNTMIGVLTEDHIIMAKARGIPHRLVLYRHAMKNSLLPVISSLGIQLSRALAGAVIVETVFSYQGLGYTLFTAVESQDFPTVQAVFFLVAVMVIVGNFLVQKM